MNLKRILCILAGFTACSEIFSEGFARIEDLVSRNVVFKQYQQEVEDANKAMFLGKELEPYINFYSYRATKSDTVMSIYARCSIRYDTLVTINGIESKDENLEGRDLVLPTVNGLYIPHDPQTSIDILLAKEHSVQLLGGEYASYKINGRDFYFIPDGKFSPTERAYYLEPEMTLPLAKSVLTSSFGMRISPISGKWLMHNGIDMAAPVGTNIYACKSGTVSTVTNMDSVYGNYVIIAHGGGMTSLYAHMSRILVSKGQKVGAGYVIGLVGATGMATGPHLHFEIRLNGTPQDPQMYLQNL